MIRKTGSICPVCHRVIEASIFEEGGAVWIGKACPAHGEFRDEYWSDAQMYDYAQRYAVEGCGIENPQTEKAGCPYACGICREHLSQTVLGLVFLTNRCNLRCWYCFASMGRHNYVYEPSFGQVEGMLRTLRENRPVPADAVMFTGGEPTLRDDIIGILNSANKMGFKFTLLNTHGIRVAQEPGFAEQLREASVGSLYLSFDGVTAQKNPKNHKYIPKLLENCRKQRIGITLVPTIINGVNTDQIGHIIQFALKNNDIIRSVNFQPISFAGCMPSTERLKQRITIPTLIKMIELQTGGGIPARAFQPIPSVAAFSRVAEAISGSKETTFAVHPHCGVGTYVFQNGNGTFPITDFVDLDKLFSSLQRMAKRKPGKLGKVITAVKLRLEVAKAIDLKKCPPELNLAEVITDVILKKNIAEKFHWNSLFVGTMHFQDGYNFDIERVKRCTIHYATPDGRLIPFCAYNTLTEIYREKVNEKFGIPIPEWERQTGKKIRDDRLV